MGQFKPMVKMMTTEPSIELKLKKGGKVEAPKKAKGGAASGPTTAGARGGMLPVARPAKPSMAARRKAMVGMAEGGESKAEHAAEMKTMKQTAQKLEKHASMPASKAHKGLKTGGVVMGQGGYKAGGIINTENQGGAYRNTKMHTAQGEDHTPKKTGEVVMGKPGGYKKGGKAACYAKGGGVEGNVSTSKPGVTNTTTGEVKKGNAGGYKKGGAAKKAFATGGSVNDSGRPVAYPKKAASKAVSINRLSGTFKKGGDVKMADGGKMEDLSKGAYDRSIGPSEEEMDIARAIRSMPRRMYEGAKRMMGMDEAPKAGSVTKTKESVTVAPAKKRGGLVNC